MNFNEVSDFVRLVEDARPKYRRYCAVCGCENIRWAGCIDPFHDRDKRGSDIGISDAWDNPSGTSVRVRMWSETKTSPEDGYLVGRHPEALTKPIEEAPL